MLLTAAGEVRHGLTFPVRPDNAVGVAWRAVPERRNVWFAVYFDVVELTARRRDLPIAELAVGNGKFQVRRNFFVGTGPVSVAMTQSLSSWTPCLAAHFRARVPSGSNQTVFMGQTLPLQSLLFRR